MFILSFIVGSFGGATALPILTLRVFTNEKTLRAINTPSHYRTGIIVTTNAKSQINIFASKKDLSLLNTR